MIRQTSWEAFWSIPNLGARQKAVYNVLDKPLSNWDIAKRLGKPINEITPRTNELVQKGLVRESHRDVHPVTGKRVIYWERI